MIESKPKQKSHTPIRVVFPIVDLDSICFFDKDEEEISKYKEEYSMILGYWKEFLNDPKIMEYGIKFCRDSAIRTISKGFQKDIRYSSFICKRSQIDAILHKEYNLNEVEDLFIDWLFPYHKKQQIVEIELYSR